MPTSAHTDPSLARNAKIHPYLPTVGQDHSHGDANPLFSWCQVKIFFAQSGGQRVDCSGLGLRYHPANKCFQIAVADDIRI